MKKEMICIVCPMSCRLVVEQNSDHTISKITGNNCPRGEAYARNEFLHPMRKLTSTVVIENALYSRLPVVLSDEIPKEKMMEVMKVINQVKVKAPIKINQILVENICDLSVNLIASRTMDLKKM